MSFAGCPKHDDAECRYYRGSENYYCRLSWAKTHCPNMCGTCRGKYLFVYIIMYIFILCNFLKKWLNSRLARDVIKKNNKDL